MTDLDLWKLSAKRLVTLIENREVSAREVLEAHLERIAEVDRELNAVVTLVPEMARDSALAADEKQARGGALGPLHGLPIAHKDLVLTRGIRTTFGSRFFASFVPDEDALLIERLREAGAITIGKTNTPEFGAGSQTFNEVFGATRNPWDTTRTSGGSSGGAAAALASGMVPIADGSDMGGSLRNPASFCGVVGFRPSPYLVPEDPNPADPNGLAVLGPMARSVEDVALLYRAMVESHESLGASTPKVLRERDFAGCRLAWSPTLGGLPFETGVVETIEKVLAGLTDLGSVVEHDPGWEGTNQAFQILRADAFAQRFDQLPSEAYDLAKTTLQWNVDLGRRQTRADVVRAQKLQSEARDRFAAMFEHFDFFLAPVSQVLPFDVATEVPTEIAGVEMSTYIDWMKSCCLLSVTGHPVLSVPCGLTSGGLPVGIQIVGPRNADWSTLEFGRAFERAVQFPISGLPRLVVPRS